MIVVFEARIARETGGYMPLVKSIYLDPANRTNCRNTMITVLSIVLGKFAALFTHIS